MTAADKAKQKEATGIVAALVKAATAFQTEYGDLPTDAGELKSTLGFKDVIKLIWKLRVEKFVKELTQ